MSAASRFSSFLRNLRHRDRVERELDDELRSYLEMTIDEKRRAGLTEEQARRAARLELEGFDQVKERVRDVRTGAVAEQLWRDVCYGVRMLARNSGFTGLAVTTLALGIGASTAIFSVVDTVVFRPLPYKDPGRLVKICGNAYGRPTDDVSLPDFFDIRDQNQVFEQVAADDGMSFTVTYPGGSRESVNGGVVTADWLSTLGVQPILGRGFLLEEEQPGRDRVVILTQAYWQRPFGSDPHVVGQTLTVDGGPFTVVGVLPPNVLRYGADFLRPLVPAGYPVERDHRDLDVFARLQPGVSLAQARAEIETIARRLEQEYPATNKGRGLSLLPLGKYYASIPGRAPHGLVLILGAVGLVLVIASANVANLLLARAVTRYRECVIRAALGATRVRLVRQLLVESVLLFLLGGTLGVLLATWSVESLRALAVAGNYVPERLAVAVDGRVLAFSLLVSLLCGISAGIAPALQASRVDLNEGLRDSSHASSGGLRRSRAGRLLIVSELALSLVLLIGFGLLIRSFLLMQAASGGFDPENVLETDADGGRSFVPALTFWQTALERTQGIPGVQFAAVTSRPPVRQARPQQFAIAGDLGAPAGEEPRAGDVLISADYFRTMGIPLLRGRAFTERDGASAPPVVIISESLARRYFPHEDPLGRRVSLKERLPMSCCSAAGAVEGVWREIVGVVGDVRQRNLDEEPAVTLYRPYSQIVEHDMYLMVRARSPSDATRVASHLRSRLPAVDPGREWSDIRLMRQVIEGSESIRLRRFVLILLGGFAGSALLLAAVGVYGVMAYTVAERTREIGIRMALGATRPLVLRQVLRETMTLAFGGLAVGGLAALVLTRFISTMLFGISPTDAVTYLGVSLLFSSIAVLASSIPARRATHVDPVVALRHE